MGNTQKVHKKSQNTIYPIANVENIRIRTLNCKSPHLKTITFQFQPESRILDMTNIDQNETAFLNFSRQFQRQTDKPEQFNIKIRPQQIEKFHAMLRDTIRKQIQSMQQDIKEVTVNIGKKYIKQQKMRKHILLAAIQAMFIIYMRQVKTINLRNSIITLYLGNDKEGFKQSQVLQAKQSFEFNMKEFIGDQPGLKI